MELGASTVRVSLGLLHDCVSKLAMCKRLLTTLEFDEV
jgi:hypothetical protein